MQDLAGKFVLEMRRRRQALLLSQQGLGEKLSIDRNTVSRIERGAPNITVGDAAAIAKALGTTLQELLGASGHVEEKSALQDTFSRRVREVRVSMGLNQRELAALMNVDRNWVSAIETSSPNITLRTLEKFSTALNVLPYQLLQ